MRVRYEEVEGHLEPYYQCTEAAVRRAGKLCQSVRGRPIDEAISALLVESVAPSAPATRWSPGSLQNLGVEECARLATAFSLGALGEIGPRLPARDVIEAFTHQVTTRRIAP